MNDCNFTGRLTAVPELKTTNSGLSVCSFTLAVKRPKVKDTTDFLNFVAWRQNAEYLCKYGKKGNLVGVSGVATSRAYEDKNNNKRVAFEIVVNDLELLSNGTQGESKQTPTESGEMQNSPFSAQSVAFEEMTGDDELPF